VKVARDDEATAGFLDRYVTGPGDQAGYLEAVGGAERLIELTGR
jgi:hypothetical protein